jgi:PKD repeat protein
MTRAATVTKVALSIGIGLALATSTATDSQGANGAVTTISITSVSGYAGHAFVYAQVSDSTFAFPAPTGTGHQSPFFSEWVAQPIASPSCPWIWAVYVFDRTTKRQINTPPPNAPPPNFGTTTVLCASPTATPVAQPPQADAAARLDLDLQVAVSPAIATAGSTSVVSALLSNALTQDLNLYLSMAIEDWSVTSWSIDFGDGQMTTSNAPVGASIQVPHVYQAAGTYDARVVAFISGHAQAAVYDRYGTVHLLRRPFSVEVGNHAMATASRGRRPATCHRERSSESSPTSEWWSVRPRPPHFVISTVSAGRSRASPSGCWLFVRVS